MNTEGGLPNAEGAEVSQKTQKRNQEISSWLFFCALCETFASSAFKVPVPAS